jgi:coenzyme PQQ synthesis protein D (PqqD)
VADTAPRRAAGVTYEVIDGQAVVIDPEGRELVTLNQVGTQIWEHLDGRRDVGQLVDELLDNFDGVSREQFQADVVTYLDELRAAGILEPGPGP